MSRQATTLFAALLLAAALAVGTARADAKKSFPSALGVTGDVGFGGLGGEAYTTLQTGIDIQEGRLSLGLFGRVRILMQEDTGSGVVRRRDWDEVSDYVHILRYLRYRRTFHSKALGPVRLSAQAGEILGYTLGHGTLIRDYTNIGDPDHPHAGLHFLVAAKRWRFGTMIDNFINPSVVANRFTVRPFEQAPGLQAGASLVVDPRAPVLIDADRESEARLMDRAYNLQAWTEPLALVGLDLEYMVGSAADRNLTPYLDLNTSMHGVGLHAGSTGEARLGEGRVRVFGQLEYRLATGGYAPTHVGTFYDVERYQAGLSWTDPETATIHELSPKLVGLVRGVYGGHGLLAQAGVGLQRLVQLKIGVSYRPGPDAVTMWWRATSNPVKRLHIGLLMTLRGLGGEHEGTNGLMTMAEARVRVTDNIYGMAQYSRLWALDEKTGFYSIIQCFNLSAGVSWSS